MKINVDKATCITCGLCYGLLPEVFKIDDNQVVAVNNDIVEELIDNVMEAKNNCPVEAINFVTENEDEKNGEKE